MRTVERALVALRFLKGYRRLMNHASPHPAVDYLITGGGGFVGTALTEALLARGERVCCLDTEPFWRLSHLREHPSLRLVRGDTLDRELIEELVASAGAVLHLAAVVGVDRYVADPAAVLDVNIGGTRLVAEACLRHDRPMLLTSSSEAYGKTPVDLGEDADMTLGCSSNIRWSYAVSKYAAEQYLYAFGRKGLRFLVVRYFNVYGDKMDRPGEGRVISKFLGFLQRGEPLPLVDGGQAVRSFCHVEDAVRATLLLLDGLAARDAAVVGRRFNVGRDEPITMAALAAKIVGLAAHAPGTVEVAGERFFGLGFEEIPRRVPRLDALREATGFEAKIDLQEGLRRVLKYWNLLADSSAEGSDETDKLLPLIAPKIEPDAALVSRLLTSLQSGQVTNNGPILRAFEGELGAYFEGPAPVVVSSGSAALSLAAAALGRQGAAVLPAFTYIATLNALVHAGLEPLFCDIREDDFTMDPDCLASILAAHPEVSVVAPVNVYGVHPDLDRLSALASEAGADLFYDNAHGMGSIYQGRALPLAPTAQVISLHGTKIVPAVEGGLVSASDPKLLREMRRLRTHGLHAADLLRSTPGFNLKLSELHAAVGRHTLRALPEVVKRRQGYAQVLIEGLERRRPGLFLPQRIPEDQCSNYQFFAVLWGRPEVASLQTLIDAIVARGVQARRFFWPPLHELDAWRGRFDLPVTDRVSERLLCLPLHSRMRPEALERILDAVDGAVGELLP